MASRIKYEIRRTKSGFEVFNHTWGKVSFTGKERWECQRFIDGQRAVMSKSIGSIATFRKKWGDGKTTFDPRKQMADLP